MYRNFIEAINDLKAKYEQGLELANNKIKEVKSLLTERVDTQVGPIVTAKPGTVLPAYTSASSVTVNIPDDAPLGSKIVVIDADGNAHNNNIIINYSGKSITIDMPYKGVILYKIPSKWIVALW